MNTVDCDVAIIGAGPAGSTLAALLAGAGVSVALIDRDVFPRDKLCGEFLSYDALPILDSIGVLDAAAVEAAMLSIFRPATRGGIPVKSRVVLPFRFKL